MRRYRWACCSGKHDGHHKFVNAARCYGEYLDRHYPSQRSEDPDAQKLRLENTR